MGSNLTQTLGVVIPLIIMGYEFTDMSVLVSLNVTNKGKLLKADKTGIQRDVN